MNIWDDDREIKDAPLWCRDMTYSDAQALYEGGASSGAYMPCVTYHEASKTMFDFGDEVLTYIEDNLGELPEIPKGSSWAGISVFFLSVACELFAQQVVDQYHFEDSDEDE